MKDGVELLTKTNARAGVRVMFRGEERIIDEVVEGEMGGVWLKPVTSIEQRDFLYFSEVARFNVVVVPDDEPPPAADQVAVHDVVQIRPDASSDFRGCLAIVTGEDEQRPGERFVVEIVLPVRGRARRASSAATSSSAASCAGSGSHTSCPAPTSSRARASRPRT